MKPKFKINDRVKYISNEYGDDDDNNNNPLWNRKHGYVFGTITHVYPFPRAPHIPYKYTIKWDNGKITTYIESDLKKCLLKPDFPDELFMV